jgi:hypothetical protein
MRTLDILEYDDTYIGVCVMSTQYVSAYSNTYSVLMLQYITYIGVCVMSTQYVSAYSNTYSVLMLQFITYIGVCVMSTHYRSMRAHI